MKNQKKIAMWSGPRNISTAMMRSFENREDTYVIDEPFYAYYLKKANLKHPFREQIISSQESRLNKVIESITGLIPNNKMIWYQKHMVHHIPRNINMDWVKSFENCFLIRHPKDVIISYSKRNSINGIGDLGYIHQKYLFQKIKKITGKYPSVFDSKDILLNPEKYLKVMCNDFEIDFSKKMLYWPKGPRASDGVWASYWYKNVMNSRSFKKFKKSDEKVPRKYNHLLEKCLPYYEYLYSYKK
mgnify:FL=1